MTDTTPAVATAPRKTYYVLFSVLVPQEGGWYVDAESEEHARKIVTESMHENYKGFKIADISEVDLSDEAHTAIFEKTKSAKTLN